MQVGDRVRVKDGWGTGKCGFVRDATDSHASVLLDNNEGFLITPRENIELLPKDLAIGTRVMVRRFDGNPSLGRIELGAGGQKKVRFTASESDFLSEVEILEVLPPKDSENLVSNAAELAVDSDPCTLPFEENTMDYLDVLIASLDNESLGRVVRALREAGCL